MQVRELCLWCRCFTVLTVCQSTFWDHSLITAMNEDTPTLKPRRIQNQNVVHRLERRRICSGRPGAHWYRVRCFHQNLFPNFTVVNVEKPPCFLRKFSPDGRCFIAFSSDQTSLEVRGEEPYCVTFFHFFPLQNVWVRFFKCQTFYDFYLLAVKST